MNEQGRKPQDSDRPPSDHFEFGANWSRFLRHVDENRIATAISSLQTMLRTESLAGKTFLDVGSGSGLFSLAAHRLGASVVSLDCDPQSVACTQELKRRFAKEQPDWQILPGSILDEGLVESVGRFDVVYAWGVLHHTGEMWKAVARVARSVNEGGYFWLAIYNDQQYVSRAWWNIKRWYQRLPRAMRPAYVALIGGVLFCKRALVTLLACLLRLVTLRNPLQPIQNWFSERQSRGMLAWYDLMDWVGGWPFEVARPEEVFRFLRNRGFTLAELVTCGDGHGCNEYLFRRSAEPIIPGSEHSDR